MAAKRVGAKKRNPQDATMRNVRAANAWKHAVAQRLTALERRVLTLERLVIRHGEDLADLEGIAKAHQERLNRG